MHGVPPPPRRLRVAHDIDWQRTAALTVVHVGQSGIVLAAPGAVGGLVPITWGERGLVPGGIHLPDDTDAARLRDGVRRGRAAGRPLDLRHWGQAPALRYVDLRIGPRTVTADAVAHLRTLLTASADADADAPPLDPRRQRALAPVLARALVDGRPGASGVLRVLVGAGPGSTPAGDDVIVGVLAALATAQRADRLDAPTRARVAAAARVVTTLLPRTTRTSAHDLHAATRGSFCERVHALLDATGRLAAAERVFADARRWGATSGVDLLHGVVAGAEAVGSGRPSGLPIVA